jgi:hypothetical protein
MDCKSPTDLRHPTALGLDVIGVVEVTLLIMPL